MYKVLRSYLNGENIGKVKIRMTTPLLLRFGFHHKSLRMHAHIWIPLQDIAKLPAPVNPKLHFVETEDYCVYVRSFDGVITSYNKQIEMERIKLTYDLDLAGFNGTYKNNVYWFAAYDPPWKVYRRHNEIWLRTVGKPSGNSNTA